MTSERVESIHRLDNGSNLRVRVIEPPLEDLANTLEYWWREVREPLFRGDLAVTSLDRFFVGDVDGVYAGSMMYCTPRNTHDLALLEMVWTHPDFRRKGIASILLREMLADFRAMGGMAMYLCTTNPNAYMLYGQEGFHPLVGDGMRYLSPPYNSATFDRDYFANAGPARIRHGEWGDIARVSALYNQPDPDWLIKDYPRRVFRDMRYESHYIHVWKPASEGRGVALVLENPRQRVVGMASAIEIDSFAEQHVSVVDFWGCPAYLSQMPELLATLIQQSRSEILQVSIASCDLEKRALIEAAGFRETARMRDRLRSGDQRFDLLIYESTHTPQVPSNRLAESYYGARQSFR